MKNLKNTNIKFFVSEEGREHEGSASDRGYETPREANTPYKARRKTPAGDNLVDWSSGKTGQPDFINRLIHL